MKLTSEQSDEALARSAKAGSLDCFEQLVRRYQVPLLRFLQRRFPHRSDVEDVIQESFLRAYQSIEQFRDGAPFKPWIFTITYRMSIDHARRRRNFAESVQEPADLSDDPSIAVEASDSRNHLWDTVRRVLKEEAFTTVWLHYGQDMPTDQIATVIGRSRVWVKTTLLRSRNKIKAALQEPKVAGAL